MTSAAAPRPEIAPPPWPAGPRRPGGASTVDVWYAALEPAPGRRDELARLLAPDERERAARFYFDRDRSRYIVARALLRLILARYVDVEASELSLRYDRYGKPRLDERWEPSGIEFNVSHSGPVALIAIARGRRVGIDVEVVRPLDDALGLARSTFSPAEVAALRALPPPFFLEGFFACWTRKEAFVKARGEGLSLALDAFDVSVDPAGAAELLATRFDPAEVARWTLARIDPAPRLAAAVAVEGSDLPLRLLRWADP